MTTVKWRLTGRHQVQMEGREGREGGGVSAFRGYIDSEGP